MGWKPREIIGLGYRSDIGACVPIYRKTREEPVVLTTTDILKVLEEHYDKVIKNEIGQYQNYMNDTLKEVGKLTKEAYETLAEVRALKVQTQKMADYILAQVLDYA